ncbi:type II toxin-antitoxin system RelE/ParE family toxin [Rhodoferax sp.]|uniref:type II toxin-antitoxin system RelE/ParE family toxin n=1 Tax=Rhodoferax sp. TaxID=50421 RepID=UPI0025D322BC|nr:type II toxin-antitoxin system RelE/ParE family toxin [Rhodoferax sp.]
MREGVPRQGDVAIGECPFCLGTANEDDHLERLTRDREGQYSIRINQQWRVCFVWTEDGPCDVEIVDYH